MKFGFILKKELLVCFFSLYVCSCVIETVDEFAPKVEESGIGSNDFFYLIDTNGNCYKPFLVKDNNIHIVIPNGMDVTKLKPVFTNGDVIIANDNNYSESDYVDFSDFYNFVTFIVRVEDGTEKEYSIQIYDLPVLQIDTPDSNPIISTTERTECCKVKLSVSEGLTYTYSPADIRVRGNSTSLASKKPYSIKLWSAQSFLGMKASKKWVLLANAYYDRTQLHNAVAFEIARLTNYEWVQEGRFVELILNGEHRGLYYLCEKIDIEEGKIDISPNTGILLESDVFIGSSGEENSFITDYFNKTGFAFVDGANYECGLGWFFKVPDEDVDERKIIDIKKYMNEMESLMYEDYSLDRGGV